MSDSRRPTDEGAERPDVQDSDRDELDQTVTDAEPVEESDELDLGEAGSPADDAPPPAQRRRSAIAEALARSAAAKDRPEPEPEAPDADAQQVVPEEETVDDAVPAEEAGPVEAPARRRSSIAAALAGSAAASTAASRPDEAQVTEPDVPGTEPEPEVPEAELAESQETEPEPELVEPEPEPEMAEDVPDPEEAQPGTAETWQADSAPDERVDDEPDPSDTVLVEPDAVEDDAAGAEPWGDHDVDQDAADLESTSVQDPADDEPVHEEPVEDLVADHEDAGVASDDDPPAAGTGEGSSDESPRHRGRWVLLAAAVVLGALYVGGYFLTGTRLPADASIGGVDVSGMSPSAARAAVQEGLEPRKDEPVVLTHEDETFEIAPADAGLALDPEASVDRAGGSRSWDPRDMVALFFGSHPHAPALDVDDAALDSAVAGIAETVDVPVTEALITFPDAKPKPRDPEAGRVVRKDDTAQLIQDEYLVQTDPAQVPTAEVEPAVDAEGLREAVTAIGEPAVAEPVRIEVGDKDVELPVTAYAPALTVEPVEGAMAPVIDPEKLAEPLTDATTGIGKKAVDATVEIRDGKPVVVPGKEGVGLQPEEMAEKLVPVLTETGDERVVQVEAKVVEPVFTTEDAEALNIKEKIGEFSTQYPHAEYRNINQSRAAELIDGVILKPKESFSFNDTVGERTEANGFTTGSVINGGRFRDELGGGVSQVVTTTYNAAFFAGLEDIEHHPHAFYIDRYPAGREATVYFGSLDLRFRNNLPNGVLIRAYVDKSTPGTSGRTTVEIWGTKEFDVEEGQSARRNFRSPATRYDDADDCVAQAPLQGFDIDIFRTLKKDGKVVKREKNTATYQAADRIVCGEKPEDD